MAQIWIKNLTIAGDQVNFTVETDYTLGASLDHLTFNSSLRYGDWLVWKQKNPSGTVSDWIVSTVKARYDDMKLMSVMAAALPATVTW